MHQNFLLVAAPGLPAKGCFSTPGLVGLGIERPVPLTKKLRAQGLNPSTLLVCLRGGPLGLGFRSLGCLTTQDCS